MSNNYQDSNIQNGNKNQVAQQISNGVSESQDKQSPLIQTVDIKTASNKPQSQANPKIPFSWRMGAGIALMGLGLILDIVWVGWVGILTTFVFSLPVIVPPIKNWLFNVLSPQRTKITISVIGSLLATALLLEYIGVYRGINNWLAQFQYDEFGSWPDWIGAVGQVSVAGVAVYVAWRQYVISKDLTIQQNRITQQQTIDAYFQGITDLALNEEGLLEDWPQERAIAEGRTAAIFSGVDGSGKAKILRFLSQARLVTPLQRDTHLGRPILDGYGGYAEDRQYGVRVIDLGVMLAGTSLFYEDLRWTDLSEANLVRANLGQCDLVKANLSRTILYEANLAGADLKGTRLFYGNVENASPRSRKDPPDYETGAYTGAVIENANFNNVKRLSEEQRYYICSWGGKKTRGTVPGGCEGIPDRLHEIREKQKQK